MKTIFVATLALAATGAVFASSTAYSNKPLFIADTGAVLHDDFEAFAPKDTGLGSLTSQGITYNSFGPHFNVVVTSPGYVNFGAGVPQPTTTSILTANGDENFEAVLSNPQYAVGLDVYTNGLGPATLDFYSGSDLIVSFLWEDFDSVQFAGVTSSTPITRLHFYSTQGRQLNTGIDNILFGAGVVPDGGSTLSLLALPALALISRLRRQH